MARELDRIARLLTEDPDISAEPILEMNHQGPSSEEFEMEIDEFEDASLGNDMYHITCTISADVTPDEPAEVGHGGFPGAPGTIDWYVMKVSKVTGENGDIKMTPEVEEKFKSAIENTLTDDDIYKFVGGQSGDDDYQEYDDYDDGYGDEEYDRY